MAKNNNLPKPVTYFLLIDDGVEGGREILAFYGDVNKEKIQRRIYELGNKWTDAEFNNDLENLDTPASCLFEYIFEDKLHDEYDFEILRWYNDDKLYY